MKIKRSLLYSALAFGGLATLAYYWSELVKEVNKDAPPAPIQVIQEEKVPDEAPKTLSHPESTLHRFFYLSRALSVPGSPKKGHYPYILNPESLCLIDSASYYSYLSKSENLLQFAVKPNEEYDIFIPFSKQHIHELRGTSYFEEAKETREIPFTKIIRSLEPIAALNEEYQKLILEQKNRFHRRYHHELKFLNITHLLEDVNVAFPPGELSEDSYSNNDVSFVNIVRFVEPTSYQDPYSPNKVGFLNILSFLPMLSQPKAIPDLPQKLAPQDDFVPWEAPPSPLAEDSKTILPLHPEDGLGYSFDKIYLTLSKKHPDFPSIEELKRVPFELSYNERGWIAETDKFPKVSWNLEKIDHEDEPIVLFSSALNQISKALVSYLEKKDYLGVYITFDRKVTRPEVLEIELSLSHVQVVSSEPADHPNSKSILKNSPLKGTDGKELGSALKKGHLDRYLQYLNRHPNRRIEAELSLAGSSDAVKINYIIEDRAPWYVYGKASNTGVESLGKFLYEIGYVDTQLTNHDDIFQCVFNTNKNNKVYSGYGSYNIPISYDHKLRISSNVSYSQYESSQLGIFTKEFEGSQLAGQISLRKNIVQTKGGFIDLYVNGSVRRIKVDNHVSQTYGNEIITYPGLGVHAQSNVPYIRSILTFSGQGSFQNKVNEQLDKLGRADVTPRWFFLNWYGYINWFPGYKHSLGYHDYLALEEQAQEVIVNASGSFSFNNRLLPQMKSTIGGMTSLRGYPEAVASGDIMNQVSLDYVFHIPRIFPVRKPLSDKSFKFMPSSKYGPIDWDVSVKTFFDIGMVKNVNPDAHELKNSTLYDFGAGVSLSILEYFLFEGTWGYAVKPFESQGVKRGSQEWYFNCTLKY